MKQSGSYLWLLISIMLLLAGCAENEPEFHGGEEFFPLSTGQRWTYQKYYSCNCPQESYDSWGEETFEITGDTLIAGKIYKRYDQVYGEFTYPFRFIRREGTRYYEYVWDETEKLLLNVGKPGEVLSSERLSDVATRELKVIARHLTKKFDGRYYHNVLQVRETYRLDWANTPIVEHFDDIYYAAGVGEVFRSHHVNSEVYVYDRNHYSKLIRYEEE